MTAPIIIVDDDLDSLRLLGDMLTCSGFELISLANPHEALEMLRQIVPTLIILDLLMPSMNGLELSGHIRGLPHLATTSILMLSAQANFLEMHNPPPYQVNAFLAKPVRRLDLLTTIGNLLKETHLLRLPDPALATRVMET